MAAAFFKAGPLAEADAPANSFIEALKLAAPTGPNLNIPTIDLDVATAAIEHEAAGALMVMLAVVLWMSMAFAAVMVTAALRLGVHVAAGCMQLHARVLHRVLAVFGFATVKRLMPSLTAQAVWRWLSRLAS